MDAKKRFEFGNTEKRPTIYKSEKPIEKKDIGDEILDFICQKAKDPRDVQILVTSDFKMEFLCSGESVAFIKIVTKFGEIIELKLTDKDAKRFVDFVKSTTYWKN